MKQSQRITAAKDTLAIIEQGSYRNAGGNDIHVRREIDACVQGTRLYLPEELDSFVAKLVAQPKPYGAMRCELRNETSLHAARRVAQDGAFANPAVLNFASARNPGGGFLGGAQAQEESLARSSALYASLTACMPFYEFHRAEKSLLYSDRMIYSPRCPVFRTDNGALLDAAYTVSFITSAAPNAGAIQRNRPFESEQIPAVFRTRTAKLLALAVEQGCDALILGAWGCGAFRNNPAVVAAVFKELLSPGAAFHGRFKFVLFAVYDTSEERQIYAEFARQLQPFCQQQGVESDTGF